MEFERRHCSQVIGSVLALAALPQGALAKTRLLEPYAQSKFPGLETFVAAEAYKLGNKIGDRTLSAIGWNFSEHFLGVTESHVPEIQINAWTLLYAATDKWILETLQGQADGGTCVLANIHSLMSLNDRAANHLDGRSNFAYVRSPVDHRLWAAHWSVNSANEWIIGAVYVPHPDLDWHAGSRLFTSLAVTASDAVSSFTGDR